MILNLLRSSLMLLLNACSITKSTTNFNKFSKFLMHSTNPRNKSKTKLRYLNLLLLMWMWKSKNYPDLYLTFENLKIETLAYCNKAIMLYLSLTLFFKLRKRVKKHLQSMFRIKTPQALAISKTCLAPQIKMPKDLMHLSQRVRFLQLRKREVSK